MHIRKQCSGKCNQHGISLFIHCLVFYVKGLLIEHQSAAGVSRNKCVIKGIVYFDKWVMSIFIFMVVLTLLKVHLEICLHRRCLCESDVQVKCFIVKVISTTK